MLNAPTKPIKLENYVENQASLSPALLAPKGRIQKHVCSDLLLVFNEASSLIDLF